MLIIKHHTSISIISMALNWLSYLKTLYVRTTFDDIVVYSDHDTKSMYQSVSGSRCYKKDVRLLSIPGLVFALIFTRRITGPHSVNQKPKQSGLTSGKSSDVWTIVFQSFVECCSELNKGTFIAHIALKNIFYSVQHESLPKLRGVPIMLIGLVTNYADI